MGWCSLGRQACAAVWEEVGRCGAALQWRVSVGVGLGVGGLGGMLCGCRQETRRNHCGGCGGR